jgi:(R,R)-butanediol dehydrogenase/meso-butanediol dehydrogenase/diacetyl reductase
VRAGVLHATRDLRIEDLAEPVPGAGDVVVEVALNGLCGTDATEYGARQAMVPLSFRHPGSGHHGPTVLGHEFVGTVVDTGPGAEAWAGRRVACGAGVSCGRCPWCAAGRTNLCERYYTLGLNTHGGLAERVRAPASTLREIPEGLPEVEAALAQPLAVGIHGVRRAGAAPGDSVVVLGVGAIGSFVVAALADHDGDVTAVDVDDARLGTATRLGATATRLLPRDAAPEDLGDLLPGGARIVFETSGTPGATARALGAAAPGGTVVQMGLPKGPGTIPITPTVLREVDIRTAVAHVCDVDLPAALDHLARAPLSGELVDRIIGLGDVVTHGLDPLVAGEVRGKVLVDVRRP